MPRSPSVDSNIHEVLCARSGLSAGLAPFDWRNTRFWSHKIDHSIVFVTPSWRKSHGGNEIIQYAPDRRSGVYLQGSLVDIKLSKIAVAKICKYLLSSLLFNIIIILERDLSLLSLLVYYTTTCCVVEKRFRKRCQRFLNPLSLKKDPFGTKRNVVKHTSQRLHKITCRALFAIA